MSAVELARPDIRALQPYSSARMEAGDGSVWLNANESSWAPDDAADSGLNRYPQPQSPALLQRLAELYGVATTQLLVGRGSDEAIDLLVRAFCAAHESAVLISPPTFGMYAVSARIQGAAVIEAPLRAEDFTLDPQRLLAAMTPAVRLVFVCSPNNPTGAVVPLSVLENLAISLQGRALLVIDEAYVEFSADGSARELLERFDHVCILRTLSKAWGLAGARIGCLLAHADVIALLRRIMPPYPLPVPCTEAALRVLGEAGAASAAAHVATIITERERLAPALRALPGVRAVLPSQGNFLTVRFDDPQTINRALLEQGIVVRDVRRYPGLGDALRITIGRPEENAAVLAAIASVGQTA